MITKMFISVFIYSCLFSALADTANACDRVKIVNTGGDRIRVRSNPSLNSNVVGHVSASEVYDVLDIEENATAYTNVGICSYDWVNIRLSNGREGWITAVYTDCEDSYDSSCSESSSGGQTFIPSNGVIKGVDKIFVDNSVDLECLKRQGYQIFVVGYLPGVETNIRRQLERIQRSGMIPSAYFSMNGSNDIGHIDDFLAEISTTNIRTVFLDIENRVSRIDHIANTWYQKVCVEAGYKCGVYTNHGAMSHVRWPSSYETPLGEMDLWYAKWGANPNPFVMRDRFFDWNTSLGHQYKNGYTCGDKFDFNVWSTEVFL